MDTILAPPPVATHERAVLTDASRPPGLFEALDLARDHYLAAFQQARDERDRAYWRTQRNRVLAAKIIIRELLEMYPAGCYAKRLRRDLLITMLRTHRFPEWAHAVATGDYTGVVQ